MHHRPYYSLAAKINGLSLPYLYTYDANKSGLNGKKAGQIANLAGSSRGQVAPLSAPSRVRKYPYNLLISASLSVLIKKHGKCVSRDNHITSCRTLINHRHRSIGYLFSLAALVAGFHILNLIHLLKYDANKSGVNSKKAGQKANWSPSSRGQVAPLSAPSRVGKYPHNLLISAILSVLIKKHGKCISRDNHITSCHSH